MSGRSGKAGVVVIGAGPGGYVAAFRAADLGLDTVLVDSRERLGGVCLQVGCIPSKALLYVSELLAEARRAGDFGIHFEEPKVDLPALRQWKEGVVHKLTSGLSQLADRRGVRVLQGKARFEGSGTLRVEGSEPAEIQFEHAIIATGSRPAAVPGIDMDSPRVMDSTGALELEEIPERLLVVGGGYIGLELGSVYASLGSRVTLVELTEDLLPGVDRDLVRPLARRIKSLFEAVELKTRVTEVRDKRKKLEVVLEGESGAEPRTFDKVLVSVGRKPNSDHLGLENTKVELDGPGFIQTDAQCRTADPRLFAIGDVAGQPMLAHKAFREGKVAAQVIAGRADALDNPAIPAVVFTDPEIAWCGLTEAAAESQGREIGVGRFPWGASSRAVTMGRSDGLTKIVFDPETSRVLGVGLVGPRAGELIAEGVLAVEMAAVAEDLAATIHAHPTLSETVGEAAEAFLGEAIHIYRG